MTKLPDAELADLVATKVMGWRKESNAGVPDLPMEPDWIDGNNVNVCECGDFDPCNDWNDAFVALNALNDREMDEFEEIITKPLNRHNLHELRENLNPRKLTESILKAVGVDVE